MKVTGRTPVSNQTGSALSTLFRPRGIAIAGSSSSPAKAGHQVLKNLLEAGYTGTLSVIHPKASSILGINGYPDLMSVPGVVEMLILALPARTTPELAQQIRLRKMQKGDLQVVVAIAGGFAETHTTEGQGYQDLLVEACLTAGVRLVGPNCIGVIDNQNRLDTTFLTGVHRHPSGISLLSQCGGMGAWAALEWGAMPVPVGVNKFVSLGNMAEVDMAEALNYLSRDPSTRTIGLCVEGDPSAFMEAAGRAASRKPVVVLNVGRGERGAVGAGSQTAAEYETGFRQLGLIHAQRIDDFAVSLSAFDRLPLPLGGRVSVLTNAAGPGAYTLDVLAENGLPLARFSPATRASFRATLPPCAAIGEADAYVEMTSGVGSRQVAQAVASALRDPGVDAVLHLFVPTKYAIAEDMARELLSLLPGLKRNSLDKPLFLVLLAGHGVAQARRLLEENGMMTFGSPDQAAFALSAMVRYGAKRRAQPES